MVLLLKLNLFQIVSYIFLLMVAKRTDTSMRAEASLEPCQKSKMELFLEILDDLQAKL